MQVPQSGNMLGMPGFINRPDTSYMHTIPAMKQIGKNVAKNLQKTIEKSNSLDKDLKWSIPKESALFKS